MELAIAGSIAGTAKIVEPRQHRQQAVQIFETAQITLGEIGLLGCHRSPPANMTVKSCAESNAQISCRTGVGTFIVYQESKQSKDPCAWAGRPRGRKVNSRLRR